MRSPLAGFVEKRVVARLAVMEWGLQMRKRLQELPRGAKKPVPYIEMPIYVGNKISGQSKNRDKKSSLFTFYKVFQNQ